MKNSPRGAPGPEGGGLGLEEPPCATALVMGSAVYQSQSPLWPPWPPSPERELDPRAWLMLYQEQGSWTREQRALGSYCAPGGSWVHGGSQHQASPTPTPGQIQSRVEGQLRRLQMGRHDASRVPGICLGQALHHVSLGA